MGLSIASLRNRNFLTLSPTEFVFVFVLLFKCLKLFIRKKKHTHLSAFCNSLSFMAPPFYSSFFCPLFN